MAIRHEGIPAEELDKFEKGVLRIEAREIPGIGMEVDAQGCLGDASYLALAGQIVDVVLKNAQPSDDHDRIIDMTRAMTLLNHLAGVNAERSSGVDQSHREDIKPGPAATQPLTDEDRRQLTPGKMEIVALETADDVVATIKGSVSGRALAAVAAQLIQVMDQHKREDDHPIKLMLIAQALGALNILAGCDAKDAQGLRKSTREAEPVGNA
jgi:hypothetical protein